MEIKHTTSFIQTFSSIRQLLSLNWKYYKVELKSLLFTLNHFKNKAFRKAYLQIVWRYLLRNPFLIAKEEAGKTAKKHLAIYGETPLQTFAAIAETLDLKEQDLFIDLGSGRGLICFFAATVIGCETIGLEYIDELALHSKEVAKSLKIENVHFLQEDMKDVDLSRCSFLYFYGLHLPDEETTALQKKLHTLPSQAKIVSISFPLAEGKEFSLYKRFSASFPWGTTDVFCQIRK